MSTPRRSTRSQSRELGLLDSDGEVSELASASGRQSNGQAREKRSRVSTRRKSKKPETIEEEDLISAETVAESSDQSQVTREEIVEEVEVDKIVNITDPEVSNLPESVKPNKLRQRIIRLIGKLVFLLPYLPPILIVASILLATLLSSPNEPFARKVYVDENALQPGSATVEWGWSQVNFADQAADRIATVADAPADV